MIKIQDKHNCCGCEACVQICPKHCISFEEDSEGFRYPFVENSTCIECGLCEKVCPVLHQAESLKPIKVYAAQNINEEELLASSSGGLFILLAKKTLQDGGVVFGAKFDKDWNVIHSKAETQEDVKSFMGSKYVQSRIGNTYAQAKKLLKQGRKVLFTGTSCQIAGLKNFLQKDYENLLTVDVICHGVPSPLVWRKYLKELKHNAQVEGITFRDKRSGWKKYSFTLTLAEASADGKKNTVSLSHIFNEDPYMQLFLRNLILRPSCYQCPAKNGKSQSDLTIADFWGIEQSYPHLDDNRGVGLLMVNSERGWQYIRELPLKLEEVSFANAIVCNSAYINSVAEDSKRRKNFFRLLESSAKSIDKIAQIQLRDSLFIRIKRIIKKIIE